MGLGPLPRRPLAICGWGWWMPDQYGRLSLEEIVRRAGLAPAMDSTRADASECRPSTGVVLGPDHCLPGSPQLAGDFVFGKGEPKRCGPPRP